MNWHNTPFRFGSLSIGLHWLMLLLFIGVYGSIELRELFEKGSDPREMLKSWHFMLGLLLFALVTVIATGFKAALNREKESVSFIRPRQNQPVQPKPAADSHKDDIELPPFMR